jgi:hypothetical protein
MKTPKGIYVDIVDAKSGLKPLDFEIEDGTTFVRMAAHVPFHVRVVSPQLADVVVTIDGVERLKKERVAAKQAVLLGNEDGTPFTFAEPGVTAPAADAQVQQTLFPVDDARTTAEQSTNGLVIVSVRLSDQPASRGTPPVVGGKPHHCVFQLNEPKAHSHALSDNLHRVVPPEAPTRRRCSCCQ